MPKFIPPPEAPIFEPSREEFKDPLSYIAKIRPIAEKSGICKIRPPSDWRPPFSVDVPQFRFTPRIQRLNELEATTRVKLNFLDAVAKYWELQGTTMRLPTVEGAPLDLLKLWKLVEEEGGFHQATKEKRWSQIAFKMGFMKFQGFGSVIRNHYEKILFPYSVFKNVQFAESKTKKEADCSPGPSAGASSNGGDSNGLTAAAADTERGYASSTLGVDDAMDEDSTFNSDSAWSPTPSEERACGAGVAAAAAATTSSMTSSSSPLASAASRPSCTVGEPTPGASTSGSSSVTTRRSRRMAGGVDPLLSASTHAAIGVRDKKNRELQRLQFLSPGPKILESKAEPETQDTKVEEELENGKPVVTVTKPDGTLDVDSIVCYSCRHGDGEDCMLLCDVCNASYHTYCLVPPLRGVPPGDWRCPPCVAKECSKPQEAFGFEQADKVYTLHTFQTFANRFKGDYFGTAPHLVPTSDVEQEFWRLVHSIDDDVAVEYGADLHSSDHGSGFPMGQGGDDIHQYYSECGWNLNNLPNLEASVLRHITADISGMKVPWLYVGMCFSSFCWHNEDHWSYSINYLHWGEPKTWYGVPGGCSDQFEAAMRSAVPELFHDTPDLLHHLVTLISPNTLMEHHVPVVRTNQHAGEFVVTFPRAYHAGFNQGYNFAEAVNFCPADWIPHGRSCMAHYQQLHRYTVFAHDELVCKMAMLVKHLGVRMAAELYSDMNVMVDNERVLRGKVAAMGVKESEREAFELLPDDERQCRHCQALCFLSAITCPCSPGKLVCLDHADKLCSCPVKQSCLRYRYTLSELPSMLMEVQHRAQPFTIWQDRIRSALTAVGDDRPTMADLKALIREGAERDFSSTLVAPMEEAIAEAERCSLVAAQLVSVRPRTRHKSADRISKNELDEFVSQVDKLICRIDCVPLMRLRDTVTALEETSKAAVENGSTDIDLLDSLLKEACSATIEISCLPDLELCLQQAKWVHMARELVSATPLLASVRQHLCKAEDMPANVAMLELVNTLKHFQSSGLAFEELLQTLLRARMTISGLEEVMRDSKLIPVEVPSMTAIQSMLKSATQWTKDAHALLHTSEKPEVELLESLISRSHALNVHLPEVSHLANIQSSVHKWRARLTMFIKHGQLSHSPSPLAVLYPRTDVLHRLDPRHKPINIAQRRRSLKPSDEAAFIFDLAAAELEHVRKLRAHYLAAYFRDCKSATPIVHGLYCHCRRPLADCMLRCELCLNYYHRDCLQAGEVADRYGRLVCAPCVRSPKPSLADVGELYADLRTMKAQVPEAVCLRVLLQRAFLWQIQARYSLSTALQIFEDATAPAAVQLRAVGVRLFMPSPAEMNRMMQIVVSSTSVAAGGSGGSGGSGLGFEKRAINSYLSPLGLRSLDQNVVQALNAQQPACVLSVDVCAHLEELMLLGDLLEVSLDEVSLLWTVLKANHQQMNNIRVQTRAPLQQQQQQQQQQQSSMSGMQDGNNGQRRSTSPEPKKKKKKRSLPDTPSPGQASNAASENSDEVCEAKRCLRPSKNCVEVEWVQCDDCNLWYHLLCIDLPPHVAHSVEKFSCFRCDGKAKLSAAPPPPAASYGGRVAQPPPPQQQRNSHSVNSVPLHLRC